MKKTILAAIALALAATGCENKAKLCEAIGETRVSALQPRDRIYWEENCVAKPEPRKVTEAELREDERRRKDEALTDRAKKMMSKKCYDAGSFHNTPECEAELAGIKAALSGSL